MRGWASAKVAATIAGVLTLYAVQLFAEHRAYPNAPHLWERVIIIATACAQTLLLYLFYRNSEGVRSYRSLIGLGVAVFTFLSVIVAVDPNWDIAAYIGYGKAATWGEAYHPVPVTYHNHGFEQINAEWGPRLPGLVYGPLWLAVDRLLVTNAPTYAIAQLILRVFNAALLLAIFALLLRLKIPGRIVALVALNPALYTYYVVQAHNDLLPIALVIAAMAMAKRYPIVAAIVAGSAGLVKISFLLVSPTAYVGRRSFSVAVGLFALGVAVTVLGSVLFGGTAYYEAMVATGGRRLFERSDLSHTIGTLLRAAAALVSVAALIYAAVRRRFIAAGTYGFAALGPIIYPHYLGWCVPYALRATTFTAAFFISLPALSRIIDPRVSLYPSHEFAVVDVGLLAVVVWAAVSFFQVLRDRVPS
jgi:hypothetical protein